MVHFSSWLSFQVDQATRAGQAMSYPPESNRLLRYPVSANKSSILFGAIGTALVFGVGPISYWVTALCTGEWVFTGLLFTGIYGPAGIVLGVIGITKIRSEVPMGAMPSRVLGVLSIVGGAMASFFCLFFLFIFGLAVSFN